MTRILVSQRLVNHESYGEVRACLDEAWGPFFSEAGAHPVPLLTTMNASEMWDVMPMPNSELALKVTTTSKWAPLHRAREISFEISF